MQSKIHKYQNKFLTISKTTILILSIMTTQLLSAQSLAKKPMPKEAITIHVTFTAQNGKANVAKQDVLGLSKQVTDEPGNVHVKMYQNPENEHEFTFYETFGSRELEKKHTQYPYMAAFYQRLGSYVQEGTANTEYWKLYSYTYGKGMNTIYDKSKEVSFKIKFTTKEGKEEEAKRIVNDLVAHVNNEDGNVEVLMFQNPENSREFMFMETFINKEAEIAHTKQDYMQVFYNDISKVLDGESALTYWHRFSDRDGRASSLGNISPFAVVMSVPELESTINWYQNVLGFEKIAEYDLTKEQGNHLVLLSKNNYMIELVKNQSSKPKEIAELPPHHYKVQGITQFTFKVPDVDLALQELKSKGVNATGEVQRNENLGVAYFWIQDLNNNLIQFIQN